MRSDTPPHGLAEDFDGTLDSRWTCTSPGGGVIEVGESRLRLLLPSARRGVYSDAQIDDYTGLRASRYPWRPPLRLEVVARASHPAAPTDATLDAPDSEPQRYLRGTAGFGFWNYPLTRAGGMPRLPNAVWFFAASPPSNMALVPGIPGWGWKAQVTHAHRWRSLALALPTLGSVAWARLSGQERGAARQVRRFVGAAEAIISSDLTAWHTYRLEWRADRAEFWVDGVATLTAATPPPGPLGFVAWIDNQYAVATPRGSFGFGTLGSGPQWLEIESLRITPL